VKFKIADGWETAGGAEIRIVPNSITEIRRAGSSPSASTVRLDPSADSSKDLYVGFTIRATGGDAGPSAQSRIVVGHEHVVASPNYVTLTLDEPLSIVSASGPTEFELSGWEIPPQCVPSAATLRVSRCRTTISKVNFDTNGYLTVTTSAEHSFSLGSSVGIRFESAGAHFRVVKTVEAVPNTTSLKVKFHDDDESAANVQNAVLGGLQAGVDVSATRGFVYAAGREGCSSPLALPAAGSRVVHAIGAYTAPSAASAQSVQNPQNMLLDQWADAQEARVRTSRTNGAEPATAILDVMLKVKSNWSGASQRSRCVSTPMDASYSLTCSALDGLDVLLSTEAARAAFCTILGCGFTSGTACTGTAHVAPQLGTSAAQCAVLRSRTNGRWTWAAGFFRPGDALTIADLDGYVVTRAEYEPPFYRGATGEAAMTLTLDTSVSLTEGHTVLQGRKFSRVTTTVFPSATTNPKLRIFTDGSGKVTKVDATDSGSDLAAGDVVVVSASALPGALNDLTFELVADDLTGGGIKSDAQLASRIVDNTGTLDGGAFGYVREGSSNSNTAKVSVVQGVFQESDRYDDPDISEKIDGSAVTVNTVDLDDESSSRAGSAKAGCTVDRGRCELAGASCWNVAAAACTGAQVAPEAQCHHQDNQTNADGETCSLLDGCEWSNQRFLAHYISFFMNQC
jgi:hypothetical protein